MSFFSLARSVLPLLAASSLIAACDDRAPLQPADVVAWPAAFESVSGLAVDDTGAVHLLDAFEGIAVLKPDGAVEEQVAFQLAPPSSGFGDLAIVDAESYAAPSSDEVSLILRSTGERTSFFCLEPGFEPEPEPEPGEPQILTRRVNLAVAVDREQEVGIAAPVELDDASGAIVSASIVVYDTSTAELQRAIDITELGVLPSGIALGAGGDGFLLASRDELISIDDDGVELDRRALPAGTEAVGLDVVGEQAWIADAETRTAIAFDLDRP